MGILLFFTCFHYIFQMLTLQVTISYMFRLPPKYVHENEASACPTFWAVGLCFWMVQMESCAPSGPKASKQQLYFVSFQGLPSVRHGHGTQALHWCCAKKKGSRQDFPLLNVGKQCLVEVSTPDRSGCKFVHLGPPGII